VNILSVDFLESNSFIFEGLKLLPKTLNFKRVYYMK